jgi:hypothetical protein
MMRQMKPKTQGKVAAETLGIPVHCAHLRMADLVSLRPNPRNPNKHSEKQIALLAKVIKHQGWRAPITVSKRSGLVVAGHGRLEAARLLGASQVPVDEQDFASDEDELAHLVADNRLAELADADRAMLKDLAEQMDTGAFDMDLTGFDGEALEELMTATAPETDIKEVAVAEPPKMAWVLIGIPLVRFGEINEWVEAIAKITGTMVETTISDFGADENQN